MAVPRSYCCFNTSDLFASEVVLNKSGMDYDLRFISRSTNVIIDKDETLITYRSHFDPRVAVILQVVKNEFNMPSGISILRGLSIRIQIPTKTIKIDDVDDLIEAIDTQKETFDFKSAMKAEIDWLRAYGVIKGIKSDDVDSILSVLKAGNAGWNSRIIFNGKDWVPFYESDYKIFVIREADCSEFSLKNLPAGEIIFPVTNVNANTNYTTKWGVIKSNY